MNFLLEKAAATLFAAGAALALPATAQAQAAGSYSVRLGATRIQPDVHSGDLSAPSLSHSQADIKADTQVGGGVTYMLTDHWAVDAPLALPFKHDIVGAGSISGVGKIGEVRSLPVTVFGEYKFLEPASQFRPSLGAGITYARFYKARGTAALTALTGGTPGTPTTLSVGSKLALSLDAGISMALTPRWFLDATIVHTFLKTRTTLSTGQTLDTRVNPNAFSLAVGYQF